MSQTVSGIFNNRSEAQRAVDGLLAAGFGQADISVLMSDSTQGREFNVTPATKAPEGAVAGATAGSVLGGIVATLVAVGTLVIPGVNLVAAGPVVAALAGVGAGGAVGGLVGGAVGAGIPEHEAAMVAEKVASGGILVGVVTLPDRAKLAAEVLRTSGGHHVH